MKNKFKISIVLTRKCLPFSKPENLHMNSHIIPNRILLHGIKICRNIELNSDINPANAMTILNLFIVFSALKKYEVGVLIHIQS